MPRLRGVYGIESLGLRPLHHSDQGPSRPPARLRQPWQEITTVAEPWSLQVGNAVAIATPAHLLGAHVLYTVWSPTGPPTWSPELWR